MIATVDNGLSLIECTIISSEGIAVEAWRNPWRNSAVSGGSTRFFPSDTILATPGGVSSNSSLSARIDSLYEAVVDSASCALSILPEFHEDRRDEILRKVKSTLR